MRQIAICWALGIVACQFLSDLPSPSWLFLSLHCFLLILNKNKHLKNIGWIGLGFFYAMGTAHDILNHRLPIDLEGKYIEVHERITNIPQYTDYGARFEFEVDDPALQTRLTWTKNTPQNLQTNQRYKLKVRLKQVHGLRNPNTFDQERWFFQNRIRAQGTVKSGELLENNFNLRFQIYQFLKEKMQDLPRSGILIALILGETNGISQHEWKILKNTGTIHLISVSGTHLTLMAFFSAFIITLIVRIMGGSWLLKINAHTLIALLSFIIVALYAWLSGFSIPTQRSLIMIGTLFLGIIFNHRFSNSYILSIALFLVLLFDPLAVLSIGFWLSFGAITLLLYISQNNATFLFQKMFNIKGNIIIFIGLAMPLILFFGQLPILSIPANIIAIFMIGFLVMPFLFLGIILLPIFGYYLLLLSGYFLEITMLYLDILATSDFSLIYLPNAPTWALGFAMMGSFLVLMPRGMVGKWISIAWFLPALFPHLEKPKEGEIYFDLLDVGQGLSAVIQTKNHILIYDTAPAFEQKVVAESTLIPFLRGKGIQDISRLVISHPHFDHAGGVKSLMQTFEINDILTTEPTRWKNASYCKYGQVWEWDGVKFEMLAGEEKHYYNNSCVLKITTGKHAILLTGDIEKNQELKLAYERNIKANIVIAPHHGSKTSSSLMFINAVRPDYALFSVGYKNQFKHPRPEIIQRYQMVGAQILETQNSGMISFQITPENISKPQRYREINRRYWHR